MTVLVGIAQLIAHLVRHAVAEARDLSVEGRLHEAHRLAQTARHVVSHRDSATARGANEELHTPRLGKLPEDLGDLLVLESNLSSYQACVEIDAASRLI